MGGISIDTIGLPQENGAPNVVVYQNPMYSWLDSSLVIPSENWPENQQPNFLAYFTCPFPLRKSLPPFSDHSYQMTQTKRLIDAFEQWLNDNAGLFWPKATSVPYPQGLDYKFLAAPNDIVQGFDRLESQFFRANVRPTDHYTLSVPNSEKSRMKADLKIFFSAVTGLILVSMSVILMGRSNLGSRQRKLFVTK